MNDVMVDLETLSTKPNAAIVSIGAVFFDPKTGELGDTYYQVIDIETYGLTVNFKLLWQHVNNFFTWTHY